MSGSSAIGGDFNRKISLTDISAEYAAARETQRKEEVLKNYEDIRFTFDCEAQGLFKDSFAYGYVVTARKKKPEGGFAVPPDEFVILEKGECCTAEPLKSLENLSAFTIRNVLRHSALALSWLNLDALNTHLEDWVGTSLNVEPSPKEDPDKRKAFIDSMREKGVIKESFDNTDLDKVPNYVATSHELRKKFAGAMTEWKSKGASFYVDYPISVESPFITSIVRDPEIKMDPYDIPYPILDIFSMQKALGKSPEKQERDKWMRDQAALVYPTIKDLPLHNALNDSIIAAAALYRWEDDKKKRVIDFP